MMLFLCLGKNLSPLNWFFRGGFLLFGICTTPLFASAENKDDYYCDEESGFVYDHEHRLCHNGKEAQGPFPDGMIQSCVANGGGQPCFNSRWNYVFARELRGNGFCVLGAQYDASIGYCTWEDHVYGPFLKRHVEQCFADGGSDICKTNRWPKSFVPIKQAPSNAEENEIHHCDVIIAGGTTAALASALTAASEGSRVCLVEPTDWPGGQLTSEGVSAVDFPHHRTDSGLNMTYWGGQRVNNSKLFMDLLTSFRGNPGNCWVSKKCLTPKQALGLINGYIKQSSNLKVFLNSVVKKAEVVGKNIKSVHIIKRSPKYGDGYARFLSQDIYDWYSPEDSVHFHKEVIKLQGPESGRDAVFIDASSFGDLLVLAEADFLQGAEAKDGGLKYTNNGDTCGQALVFPFAIDMKSTGDIEATHPGPYPDFYGFLNHDWKKVWTYRRVKAGAGCRGKSSTYNGVCEQDISLQNWNPGNDFAYGYLFQSIQKAKQSIADWKGGIDVSVLKEAEQHALGWYHWYKKKVPRSVSRKMRLNRDALGTQHGLSKMPYLRDTRRSIGINGFVMTAAHIKGNKASHPTGHRYRDAVAIGAYLADFHPLDPSVCRLPTYVYTKPLDTRPFFIPFRALTNRSRDNLLVAGKTMAQSFWVNSATRLQPIEWASGTAAGVIAAHMFRWNLSSTTAYKHYEDVRYTIKKYQPVKWTIKGVKYGF